MSRCGCGVVFFCASNLGHPPPMKKPDPFLPPHQNDDDNNKKTTWATPPPHLPPQFLARSIRSVIHHNSDPHPTTLNLRKSRNNRDKNNRPAGILGTLLVTLTLDHARLERLLWIFVSRDSEFELMDSDAKLTFEHVCSYIWLAVSFM